MKIDPRNTKMEYSVRPLRHLLMSFSDKYGEEELKRFVENTGLTMEYLNDENNWVSYDYVCGLFERLVDYTNDPAAPCNFVITSTIKHGKEGWGIIITILTALTSCSFAYRKIVDISPRFLKAGTLKLLELGRNKAVIEYRLKDDLKPDRNDCLFTKGQFASLPVFWNLPPARIKEVQCAAQGADSCVYDIRWTGPSYRKRSYLVFAGGAAISFILFLFIKIGLPGYDFLSWVSMFFMPVVFFMAGRIWDAKKTARNNIDVMDGQNELIMKSLEEIENLHAKLQDEVEKRTEELQASNEKLGKKLVELSESEDRLVQTEKMAAIGRLAAGMAHDLNSPIGTIRNIMQDILEELPMHDPRWERLNIADRIIFRCSRVVRDLLSFSRESSNLKMVKLNINEVIEKAVIEAQREFGEREITVNKDFKEPQTAEADSAQLQQVFRNILLNAGDAITRDGEIYIRTYGDDENVYSEIRDTGEGISGDIIGKIFDPFFTTRLSGPRRGIGLAVSYNIIKRLNGDIEVKSDFGRGTTFTIKIPRETDITGV